MAEANTAFRENMREKLGEGYRTVLGHLRHEIGHYYWDRLIQSGPELDAYRALFGDEREDYAQALERHYAAGPRSDWADTFISPYATMHPWEDWAESWAHYLHMVDTLETANSHGLSVRVPGQPAQRVSTELLPRGAFDSLASSWQAVTLALNSLARSMGVKDVYPFVLSPPVLEKLAFIHRVIASSALPHSATAPCAPAMRDSTDGFLLPCHRRASTAARCARSSRRGARTAVSFLARRRPRRVATGRACAAGPSWRPATPASTRPRGWRRLPRA